MPGERLLERAEVLGIGWLRENNFGCCRKGLKSGYKDQKSLYELLRKEVILRKPVDNFLRFDANSRNVLFGIALAFYDAGIIYAQDEKQNIAILATNQSGSNEANSAYFKDYIDNGRTLSRGNLFIYTLPSSPLAESSIHFGLTGPLLYLGFNKNAFPGLLEVAKGIIGEEKSRMVLAIKFDLNHTLCFLLKNKE